MDIILYTPGTCGNMVTAVIDNNGYNFDGKHYECFNERKKLRNTFYQRTMTDEDRDNYIIEIAKKYKSLASHQYNYHIDRGHQYILVIPSTDEEIQWSIHRFNNIHPHIAMNVTNAPNYYNNFINEAKQHTNKIITLTDIWSGNLLNRLKEYISTPLDEEVYYQWLAKEINTKTVY